MDEDQLETFDAAIDAMITRVKNHIDLPEESSITITKQEYEAMFPREATVRDSLQGAEVTLRNPSWDELIAMGRTTTNVISLSHIATSQTGTRFVTESYLYDPSMNMYALFCVTLTSTKPRDIKKLPQVVLEELPKIKAVADLRRNILKIQMNTCWQ